MGREQPRRFSGRTSGRLIGLWLLVVLLGGALALPSLLAAASRQASLASCAQVPVVEAGTELAQSFAQTASGAAWVRLMVEQDQRYRLEVSEAAALQLSLYDHCSRGGASFALSNGTLEFTALRDGPLFLLAERNGRAVASEASFAVSLAPAAPHRPNLAQSQEVPEAVQRRAIEFLEELRGSDLAPEWVEARLSRDVRIIYRPDLQTPAYYEFSVEKPGPNGYDPAGFIQLAAGEHDYPVAHWDVSGMSPTQELAEIAPLGARLTEFYKLDALSYASEYEAITPVGISAVVDDVVNLGDLPQRIPGLSDLPQEEAELVTEGVDSEGNVEREGPEELPLSEQEEWPSWEALKKEYETAYAPLLAAQTQRVEETWKLDQNLRTNGETLIRGDLREVFGLPNQPITAINVTGDGTTAQYLQQEQLTEETQLRGVRLVVLDEPTDPATLLPVNVEITYGSGLSETVKYAIANSQALGLTGSNVVYLPVVTQGGAGTAEVALSQTGAELNGWGPWQYWWADGNAGGIRYGQFTTGGCASGCGATAWSILFAWVDRRAAENHPLWRNHWGLYRENGGLGSNAVAPLSQDTGVRNMTSEIRGQIGTFCIAGSGATWPWRMIDASKYVRPRASTSWRMNTRYDPTGLCWFGACDRNRNLARDQIINRRAPAVVGTGWLQHYPVAYGYAQRRKRSCFLFICNTSYQRSFYVNNGWYGNNNGWTSADVWFAGVYNNP
ncbi:hypothetical protein [Candidatus Chloroploca sp. Khr17]|uniref:hypothetical protein n=1 Tax=Candidatus Chloroploca sp. Khr17 TaxID=2496869 RepID=UPI00101E05D8|nr:hypothetical protein [Candidatus Chloroploca sp. Khr17]